MLRISAAEGKGFGGGLQRLRDGVPVKLDAPQGPVALLAGNFTWDLVFLQGVGHHFRVDLNTGFFQNRERGFMDALLRRCI